MNTAHVITVSDRVSAGTMTDGSGPALVAALKQAGYEVTGQRLRRTPGPYPPDHERAMLLRRSGLRVERAEALPPTMPEALLGPVLPELLVSAFVRLKPLHRWLRRLG